MKACLIAVLASFAGAALAETDDLSAFVSSGADVYVLGEVHDNPDHHLRQAALIAAIDPAAVVFEMLTPEQADRIVPGQPVAAELLGWEESGWPDFALYAPVFEASAGRMIGGGGVDRQSVRRAMTEAPQAVFVDFWGGDSADAPAPDFGLDEPLPEAEQAAREAAQMAAHCDALPPDMLPGFVAAQRLRDAVLAGAVLAALEFDGQPVVLITGNGHARNDWGVPALLRRANPGLHVVSLGQFEAPPDEEAPFDAVALSPPIERPDPCLAFR